MSKSFGAAGQGEVMSNGGLSRGASTQLQVLEQFMFRRWSWYYLWFKVVVGMKVLCLTLVFSYCYAGELHDAVESQDYEALVRLCNQGAWLSEPDENGWTALHLAISQHDFQAASILLNAGSNVISTTPDGYTPIHFSAIYNAHELMPLLVEYRANVNEPTSNLNMETPLHLVSSLEAWNQLIELGAEKIFNSNWELPQESLVNCRF